MTAQVAADLRAAADVLERDGWTQGLFTDKETGCHCVVGALAEAITDPGISDRWLAAIHTLADSVGVTPWPASVYRWNDDDERTAAEVIAALRAAADRAEAEQ